MRHSQDVLAIMTADIPYGMCRCGCGNPAPIAKKTHKLFGHQQGKPVKFIAGHNARIQNRQSPTFEVFMSRIEKVTESGCWLWTAGENGAGYSWFNRQLGHRYSYNKFVGDIPDGLQLDHLCRVRCCVNPDHLEIVTPRTNVLRGIGPSAQYARRTHCKKGHEFTSDNTYTTPGESNRLCRICRAEYMRRWAYENR